MLTRTQWASNVPFAAAIDTSNAVDAATRCGVELICCLSVFVYRGGETALMNASYCGHDSTVLLLLEHHADVNAADK